MIYSESKSFIRKNVILLTVVYMISYITRINYGAVITEMVKAENVLKSDVSLALTASAITYGVGQLISGYLGDKIQPRNLICLGLFTTAFVNFLVPFCNNYIVITALWGINGLAQAFMWPPIVRLMSTIFKPEVYSSACVKVSWGSSFGTIAVYVLAPMLISFWSWKGIFFVGSALAVIIAFVWLKMCPLIDNKESILLTPKSNSKTKIISFLFIAIMFAIVLQGALRDGVTTWMPTYISETFNLGSSISILSGVILPVFSIFSFQMVHIIYKKWLNNELLFAGIIFSIGLISAIILSIYSNNSPILSIFLSALLTSAMHGVNLLLICIVPEHFRKFGRVSFVSGLLNSCTYVGSAISTYGIAIYSEFFGWHPTIILWAAIAFIGTAVCIIFSSKWGRFKNS